MLISLLLLFLQGAPAVACNWGAAREVGTLDPLVNESSGMAVSRNIPNRTYRHNDSGDAGRFFLMDFSGREMKIVNVTGFTPVDAEDMAIGPCSPSVDCLFIGDIGDNSRNRPSLELVVVEEKDSFPAAVPPAHRVRIRYPDGPHDAESLAVHPDGSVYILTKDAVSSQVFRLKRDQWRNSRNPVETMETVAKLDWPRLLPNTASFARLATGMDIAPDGRRFLVLNYLEAIEFFFDLSGAIPDTDALKEGRDYKRIPITTLEQQEAISYLPDGRGFLYDTERAANRTARIMRVGCQ